MPRRVVLLCGPPGAGKTTAAHQSGLRVYDRDDEQWSSDAQFTRALRAIAQDPTAQAVVIRSGATSTARAKAAAMVQATETYLVLADPTECQRRVHARARYDRRETAAAIPKWFTTFDRADGVLDFSGWDNASADGLARSRAW